MKNSRGYTAQERIMQDVEYIRGIKEISKKTLLATKALGAVDFAVEFGLITYNEWEKHIEYIFELI